MRHKEDISIEWKQKSFMECLVPVSFDRLKQVQANSYLIEGKYPVVDQGQNLIAGWTNDGAKIIKEYLPLIIFGDHTRIFKYIDFPFALGADGTKPIKPKQDEFSTRFFYYYLLTLNIPERGYNRHYKLLKEQIIRYPSLDEQQKIAAILFKIKQAIEIQESIIEKARELKKSTLHHVFAHGLRGEMLKETEIGPIPESWEVVRLGKFTSVITKGSSPRWQGFEYCREGVPFIRSQNIGDGKLLLDEIAYLPPSFNEKEKRSILQTDDLLINLVGASIGRVAIADKRVNGANINQAVAIVRFQDGALLNWFIMYYLLTTRGQEEISFNKKEIARANISLSDIGGFVIPKPLGKEQEQIVQIIRTIDEKIEIHTAKKTALQDLFKTMLNKLMTGEIRVKDLDIDVSEVSA